MKNKKNNPIILVIEDDIPLLDAITIKLKIEGFDVMGSRSVERAFGMVIEDADTKKATVNTIQSALEYLDMLEKVDLIWLDHNLIGKDNGLNFVKKFRDNGEKWAKIPILVVSNTSDIELKRQYQAIGVPDYFVKAENKLGDIVTKVKEIINA